MPLLKSDSEQTQNFWCDIEQDWHQNDKYFPMLIKDVLPLVEVGPQLDTQNTLNHMTYFVQFNEKPGSNKAV